MTSTMGKQAALLTPRREVDGRPSPALSSISPLSRMEIDKLESEFTTIFSARHSPADEFAGSLSPLFNLSSSSGGANSSSSGGSIVRRRSSISSSVFSEDFLREEAAHKQFGGETEEEGVEQGRDTDREWGSDSMARPQSRGVSGRKKMRVQQEYYRDCAASNASDGTTFARLSSGSSSGDRNQQEKRASQAAESIISMSRVSESGAGGSGSIRPLSRVNSFQREQDSPCVDGAHFEGAYMKREMGDHSLAQKLPRPQSVPPHHPHQQQQYHHDQHPQQRQQYQHQHQHQQMHSEAEVGSSNQLGPSPSASQNLTGHWTDRQQSRSPRALQSVEGETPGVGGAKRDAGPSSSPSSCSPSSSSSFSSSSSPSSSSSMFPPANISKSTVPPAKCCPDVGKDGAETGEPNVSPQPGDKSGRRPSKWTRGEDRLLEMAVKQHGEMNWKAIAKIVKTKHHTQCLQRWKRVLRPDLKKGRWTPAEDAHLVALVSQGFTNWVNLSKQLEGRTSKQCRERWCHHLDPSVKKGSYTEEEDKLIVETQLKLGNRWAQISAMLPGRTENAVKIRWKAIQRSRKLADAGSSAKAPAAKGKKAPPTGLRQMAGYARAANMRNQDQQQQKKKQQQKKNQNLAPAPLDPDHGMPPHFEKPTPKKGSLAWASPLTKGRMEGRSSGSIRSSLDSLHPYTFSPHEPLSPGDAMLAVLASSTPP